METVLKPFTKLTKKRDERGLKNQKLRDVTYGRPLTLFCVENLLLLFRLLDLLSVVVYIRENISKSL